MKQLLLLFTAFFCAFAPQAGFCQSQDIHPYVKIDNRHFVHCTVPPAASEKESKVLLKGTRLETKSTQKVLFGVDNTTSPPTYTMPKATTVTRVIRVAGPDTTIYVKPAEGKDILFRPIQHYKASIAQSHDTLYLSYEIFSNQSKIHPTDGYPVDITTVIGETGDSFDYTTGAPTAPKKDVVFNRKNTYYILVRERLPQVFPTRGFEVGTLTVPFQYRPGFHRDTLGVRGEVLGQVNADLSLALYAGWKVGKVVYRYDRHVPVTSKKYTGSIGPFFSVTRVLLDATNTKLSTNRKKDKQVYRSIASLSTGAALLFDFNDIRAGFLIGFDFAAGSQNWDFSGRPWFGFGLGYKLPFFKASN